MLVLAEDIARREKLLQIFRQQAPNNREPKEFARAPAPNMEKDVREWWEGVGISRKSAEFQRLKANSQRVQALMPPPGTMQTLDLNKNQP